METFSDRWNSGSTRGFDYLRIMLAIAVVLIHSFAISYGMGIFDRLRTDPWLYPIWVPFGFILPSFFALSGFLVAGSMHRSRTLAGFLTLRVVRLAPALAVEVLLCALVLGPLLTTVPLSEYVRDPLFHKYFRNILGIIHWELPGLFIDNPVPRTVNASLWTVPCELKCYITLVALVAVGAMRNRRTFAMLFAAISLAIPAFDIATGAFHHRIFHVEGSVLVVAFLAGIFLYLYRDAIQRSRALLAAAVALSILTLSMRELQYFCALPVAYVTIWFGLTNPPKIPFLSSGDYSYGIYLFAFPIQQSIAMVPWAHVWWINMLLTLPLCLAYAVFSWHLVEHPALRRKKHVVAFVEGTVRKIGSLPVFARLRSRTHQRSGRAAGSQV